MARLQTQSVRRMRPMLEEAQQTMPKSVDNTSLNALNYVAEQQGRAQYKRPVDWAKMEQQEKNVMAVMQHMGLRARALNNQQKHFQSQHFTEPLGSVHALGQPLRYSDVHRRQEELCALVAGLRPEHQALVANADLARRMRGFAPPVPMGLHPGAQRPGF